MLKPTQKVVFENNLKVKVSMYIYTCFPRGKSIHIFLEILKNISFNWNKLVKKVSIYTTDHQWFEVPGDDLYWPLAQQYPSCQLLDLFDYFNMDTITPKQIYFYFTEMYYFGVTLIIEERNKVTSRYLKYNRLMSSGPSLTFTFDDLEEGSFIQVVNRISQSIYSEFDMEKKCQIYPIEKYGSYKDCDDEFVQKEVSKTGLIPFWVTNNYSTVTKLRYIYHPSILKILNFFVLLFLHFPSM